jgi:hypothetical protein
VDLEQEVTVHSALVWTKKTATPHRWRALGKLVLTLDPVSVKDAHTVPKKEE